VRTKAVAHLVVVKEGLIRLVNLTRLHMKPRRKCAGDLRVKCSESHVARPTQRQAFAEARNRGVAAFMACSMHAGSTI
jgi:hypothetical protein